MTGMLLFLYLVTPSSADEAVSGLEIYEEHLEKQQQSCQDLPVGKTKVVDEWTRGGHRYGYILKRKSEKSYDVTIPIKIYAGKEYGTNDREIERTLNTEREFDRHADTKYRKLIQQCLATMNTHLTDKNGVHISLNIHPTREDAGWYNYHDVTIQQPNIRSDANNYTANIDCPTIVHELLHLVGLCDEYKENTMKHFDTPKDPKGRPLQWRKIEVNRYNCRAVPKQSTVMADQYTGIYNKFLTVKNCHCPKEPCVLPKSAIHDNYGFVVVVDDNKIPSQCPKGYRDPSGIAMVAPLKYGYIPNGANVKIADNETYYGSSSSYPADVSPSPKAWFSYVTRNKANPKPLAPAHTRHIVYPGCNAKNAKYYKCAKLAYETSTKDGCSNYERECKNDDSWLD